MKNPITGDPAVNMAMGNDLHNSVDYTKKVSDKSVKAWGKTRLICLTMKKDVTHFAKKPKTPSGSSNTNVAGGVGSQMGTDVGFSKVSWNFDLVRGHLVDEVL